MAVAILAGGASRRMGRDKALLPWRAGTLLEAMLAIARQAGADALAIAGPAARYGRFGVPCIEDRWPGRGPLAAIAGALESLPVERLLVLGCDMPFVPPRLLQWLWALDAPAGAWVVPAPESGRLEPLCAIYARALLPVITAALEAETLKIDRALAAAPRRVVRAEELTAAGFGLEAFRNLNHPRDYEVSLMSPTPV